MHLKRPFTIQPWTDSEENIGNLLMVSLNCFLFLFFINVFPMFHLSAFPHKKMKSSETQMLQERMSVLGGYIFSAHPCGSRDLIVNACYLLIYLFIGHQAISCMYSHN